MVDLIVIVLNDVLSRTHHKFTSFVKKSICLLNSSVSSIKYACPLLFYFFACDIAERDD